MEINVIFLILSIFSCILSIFSLTCLGFMVKYSLEAKIEVEAMKKSTHVIQYVDPAISSENEQFAEKMKKKEEFFEELVEKNPKVAPEDLFGF